MELQQHLGHPHPLVFNPEMNHQSEETICCFGCKRKGKGPNFSCSECGFFLHKGCAEAPIEIQHHPFHRDHPLILRQLSSIEEQGGDYCKVCHCYIGEQFSYCCSSCKIAFHLKCSLLQRDTSGNFIEILHRTHQHPLLLIDNQNFLLQYRECSGCSAELVNDSYGCFDCNIFFHKKCVELPIKISHPYHRKHKLILESDFRFCNLCQTDHSGLFYCCSICNLDFHSKCLPPSVEDKKYHEHPFTLFLRPNSFTCDACGTQGNNVSYICSTCNIQVHKDCILLSRFIRLNLHRHPLSRNFFLSICCLDSRTWDCRICYKKVNTAHGSYCCSRPNCDFVIHVKCAIDGTNKFWYDISELENPDKIEEIDESENLIIRVLRETKVGDNVVAAEIIHSSHDQHSLIFNDEINDNKHCNGCMMPIFSSFYYCSCCDFFLHKTCAELSRKTQLWIVSKPFILLTNGIFKCWACGYDCSGFSYKQEGGVKGIVFCLRCATTPHSFTYQAKESHSLFYDAEKISACSACGRCRDKKGSYICKDCDFVLNSECATLPKTIWHNCDEHPLKLVYGDSNDYSLHHWCDICEETRDPKLWFYHCEVCDNAMHLKCVLGEYPFIKLGSKYKYKNHPHPLTFIKKINYHPLCEKCREPCQDLTLECEEHGCNFVGHWKCLRVFSEAYSYHH
ncbi:hypothetical protein Gotur_024354 [Gossypium turneri]